MPTARLMAFFPGWPVILSLFSQLGVPVAISGVIISTACSAFRRCSALPARRAVGGSRLAVCTDRGLHDGALYRVAVLCTGLLGVGTGPSRSLAGCRAAHRQSPARVRVSGLFLIGALLVMIITSDEPARAKLRRAALMLIPAAVIMAFATYLYALTGSWTAWYRAQSTGWVRQLTWPWESFLNTIPAILPGAYANHPWWAAVFRGEMISMAVGVAVTIWCIVVSLRARKRPDGPDRPMWGEASWVGVQVLAFSCRTGSSRSIAPPCSGFRCGSCWVAGWLDHRPFSTGFIGCWWAVRSGSRSC